MWTYKIATGDLTRDGEYVGRGYSGRGPAKDNKDAVNVPDYGPIPPGQYAMTDTYTHPHLKPPIWALYPIPGHSKTFGRAGFLIHGDNADHTASHGCIILGPGIRQAIKKSKDRTLTVID